MDETQVSITASVACQSAKDVMVAMIEQGIPVGPEMWEEWFRKMGGSMVGIVKQAVENAPPAAAGTTVTPAPVVGQQPPPFVPQMPNGAPAVPSCPNHGTMIPNKQIPGKRTPLWKCNQSRWDRERKQEVGCPFVIWPADDQVPAA